MQKLFLSLIIGVPATIFLIMVIYTINNWQDFVSGFVVGMLLVGPAIIIPIYTFMYIATEGHPMKMIKQ